MVDHRRRGGYRLVYYYPVGEEPFNHFDEPGVQKLLAADELIATSRFGVDVLRSVPQLRGKRVGRIPLGVDSTTFRPFGPRTRGALVLIIGTPALNNN